MSSAISSSVACRSSELIFGFFIRVLKKTICFRWRKGAAIYSIFVSSHLQITHSGRFRVAEEGPENRKRWNARYNSIWEVNFKRTAATRSFRYEAERKVNFHYNFARTKLVFQVSRFIRKQTNSQHLDSPSEKFISMHIHCVCALRLPRSYAGCNLISSENQQKLGRWLFLWASGRKS